ncbi:UNVERIFIED_CONTAM: hypothetical protein FKN15_051930 [Acipenser sinensis]
MLDTAVRLAEGFEDALPATSVVALPAPASNKLRAAAPPPLPPPPSFTPTTHRPELQHHPVGGLPRTQWRARATPSGVRAEYPSVTGDCPVFLNMVGTGREGVKFLPARKSCENVAGVLIE